LKALGQGAFGKVYMVRRKETSDIYAMKMVKIAEHDTEKSLECIKREH
jgi:p70 ribosomal S6 kinase